MDFSSFDVRKYRAVSVQEGYSEWVSSYEQTVQDEMDLRLLRRIKSFKWSEISQAVDLACGTGRIGVWLKRRGVGLIDGVDITPEMIAMAQEKGVYRKLLIGDLCHLSLADQCYDLVVEVLADEHLPDISLLYQESARILRPDGILVIVGYHPYFLMQGIITHFHRANGEPVAVESYVHLMSDHVKSAHKSGLTLWEMEEGLVDEAWLRKKAKWRRYLNRPVSFVMVWGKTARPDLLSSG